MGLSSPTIQGLYNDVLAGRVVLPDFQRSFVWKADQIRELLVSLLGKFYVGTFLYMDMVTSDSPFALRTVEGVEKVNPGVQMQSLVTTILDGQQRTTSIFYALAGPDLPLRGSKGGARFFFNIPALLAKNWDGAVSYVAANNKKELDAKRKNADEIETTRILVPTDVAKELQSTPYQTVCWDVVKLLNDFLQYGFNHVELPKGTEIDRVVETFQRINEHVGEPLSITDLMVARLYKYSINFRDLLVVYRDQEYAEVDPEFALRVIALIRDGEVRRKNVLEMSPVGFLTDWADATAAIGQAFQRMLENANGYGAVAWKNVPSKHLVVMLSALLLLAKRKKRLDTKFYARLDVWYWCSVFADRYDAAVNTAIAADWKAMCSWIFETGEPPAHIARFDTDHVDLDVASRSHATYRGILNLIVVRGAHDYKTNQPPHFDARKAQDDHIFPKSQYGVDSILNRTIITASNQNKGNLIPSVFFASLIQINGRDQMEETLATHYISSRGLDCLLADDLSGFLDERKKTFRQVIEQCTALPDD